MLLTEQIDEQSIEARRKLYNDNIDILNKIRENYGVFLSKVDLENDLDEFMHERLVKLTGSSTPVVYLQDAKHYRMVELCEKLSDEDCQAIFDNYNFACLKEISI